MTSNAGATARAAGLTSPVTLATTSPPAATVTSANVPNTSATSRRRLFRSRWGSLAMAAPIVGTRKSLLRDTSQQLACRPRRSGRFDTSRVWLAADAMLAGRGSDNRRKPRFHFRGVRTRGLLQHATVPHKHEVRPEL